MTIPVRNKKKKKRDERGEVRHEAVSTREFFQADVTIRALLESLAEGVILIDASGIIVHGNARVEEMFGYLKGELIGKHHSILIPERLRNSHAGKHAGYLKEPHTRKMGELLDLSGVRKDGGEFPVEVSLSHLETPNGPLVLALISDITRRKEMEKKLHDKEEMYYQQVRASEERYRALYRDNPMMIVTVDPELRILTANPACVEDLGYSIEELENQSVLLLFIEEDRAAVAQQLKTCLRHPDGLYRSEFRKASKDGSVLWVEETAHAVHAPTGELVLLVVCQDITARKRAEEELRKSEERFHVIFNLATVGIAQVALTGKWLLMNQKLSDILGYSSDELEQMTVEEVTHPDDVAPHLLQIRRIVAGEIPSYSIEKRVLRKGGAIVWVSLSVTIVRGLDGHPEYFVAVMVDINERKKAEEDLRESEQKFASVFHLAPVGIVISTLYDGRIIEINEAVERMSGYPRSEVVGHCSAEFGIWKDNAERAAVIAEVVRKGEVREREIIMKDKAGHDLYVLFSAVVAEIRGEKYLLSLVTDLSDRRRAEEALRQSEERFRQMADNAPVMIWELGPNGRLTFVNRAGLEYTGKTLEELGDSWQQVVHPEDQDRCIETFRTALNAPLAFSLEYRLRRKDGGYGWIAVTGVPRLSANGELDGYIGSGFDITERKEAREALQFANTFLSKKVAERTAELSQTVEKLQEEIAERVRMEEKLQEETTERLSAQAELRKKELLMLHQGRLAAMGEMIGNIAHQWRQPLNVLGLLAQELAISSRKGVLKEEQLEENVRKILETIQFMSKTIDDFRTYFKVDKEKVDFKVMEIIEKMRSLLSESLKAQQIQVEVTSEDGEELRINGHPNEFLQAILNLVVNARDALLEREVSNPLVEINVRSEGHRCAITITDNAGGIPVEIIDKIFDPYFTTKGPDKGTGVGLFMAKTIIEKNMGGSLTARNTGLGAQFRIEV